MLNIGDIKSWSEAAELLEFTCANYWTFLCGIKQVGF
jgi:hypothetical protein